MKYAVVAESGSRNNYTVIVSEKISKKERNALKAFHLANPSNTLNWAFSDDNNVTWQGVGIVNGKITTLIIDNDHKISTIPTTIGKLTKLEYLNTAVNQLTNIPFQIGNLSNLKKLYLRTNSLTSLSSEIGNLTKLTELEIWGNMFTSIPQKVRFSKYRNENN